VRRNPPPIPADTTPEAWALHTAAAGARSIEKNLQLLNELLVATAEMEENAIRRQFPEHSDAEIQLEIIRRRHGEEAAKNCAPILLGQRCD